MPKPEGTRSFGCERFFAAPRMTRGRYNMDFWALVKKRRSVRKFDPKRPVSEEQTDKILEAAIWAPSAGNMQCWRFFVVRNPEVKDQLAIRAGHQPFLNDAPVLIVVCADLAQIAHSYGSRGSETFAIQDTAAAIENILLAVTDLGLAACWIGAFDEGRVSNILKLEEGIRPLAMLPIGYAADDPRPPRRRPLSEVVKRID